MPKGRSKGFGHYMCKKFFHPGNPENLERVFAARERAKAKEKHEKEKKEEYEREQERWNNKALITSEKDRDKLALSFMYNPPPGVNEKKKEEKAEGADFKFDWQRNAPRQEHAKNDPNIIDQPFGINVQFTKCIRCQVWGHAHTDKHCPKYGKSRDHEEPAKLINEKKLIQEMKDKDRLQFTSYGTWDNGKVGKHYDLVYSSVSDEEHSDLMADLLKEIRGKQRKIRVLRAKVRKASKKKKTTSRSRSRTSEERSRAKRTSSEREPRRRKKSVKTSEDGQLKDETDIKKSRLEYLNKIDDILFSEIGPPPEKPPTTETAPANLDKSSDSFLSEVDKILGLSGSSEKPQSSSSSEDEGDTASEEEDKSDSSSSSESDASDSDSDSQSDLNERDRRLLDLVNTNQIDVKINFKEKYKDTKCHFCRKVENSEHLSVCPVYDSIMTGTEFQDIKSQNIQKVKSALSNIREALIKRSKALSFTSIGPVSVENMALLELPSTSEKDERIRKAIEIINSEPLNLS